MEKINGLKQVSSSDNRFLDDIESSYLYKNFVIRNDFSKDRDRILFSKAFRRLEHKAQVYSHVKGDHFRTRLTHTLEVMQISRSIARNLGLTEDLTEAIALGHDIGHTPFGHVGEEVLDEIMRGNDPLGGKLKYKIDFLGFKHNYFSLKILDIIEKKYKDINGLNLTWQVLEGILKHTSINKNGKIWNIDRFIQKDHKKIIKDYMNYDKFSVTLEGQIVAVADEIAQRQHDLDDGLRDKDLGLRYEPVIKKLSVFIDETIQECEIKGIKVDNFQIELLKELKNRLITYSTDPDNEYKRTVLIRDVIDYFIRDVTLNSIKNICKYVVSSDRYVNKELITLSKASQIFDKKIEDYIKNIILNSYNVNRFDGKAKYLLRQLFKAYYTNPRQMPEESLQILCNKIHENSKIYSIIFKESKDIKSNVLEAIDFKSSPKEDVNYLIEILKLNPEVMIDVIGNSSGLNVSNTVDKGSVFSLENLYYKVNNYESYTLLQAHEPINRFTEDYFNLLKCLLENHYAYLSVICDYIACMTDNFANEEYRKLFLI